MLSRGEEGHEVAKGWGHEVAKGCTRVRMIMILDVDVTAERRHYNTHRPIGRYHHHPLNLLNLLNPLNPGRRAP